MKHRNLWVGLASLFNIKEIEIVCHKDIAEMVAHSLETEMAAAFNHYAPTIPMPVKAEIDICWKK